MILNPDSIENKIAVGEVIARYLIYDCGLPLLSIDDGLYFFRDTDAFKKSVKNMPLFLKMFYGFGLFGYW